MQYGQKSACGIKAIFHNGTAIFVFGNGEIIWGEREFPELANGAIDCTICPLSGALIILGDDGKLRKISAKGNITVMETAKFGFADVLLANQKRGIFAVSASRKVFVLKNTGETLFEFTPAMSPTSIAMDIAGHNLAVGHGLGVTIYDLKTNEPPIDLKVQGGVGALSFSPDICFLVAATNEPSLVGWRLHDGVGFKMAGYPAKPLSFSWFDNGKKLLTSGGPVGVAWPFIGPNGPMGTNAETFRTRNGLISAVSANGDNAILGYQDGGVDIYNLKTQQTHHIDGTAPNQSSDFNPRIGQNAIISIAQSINGKQAAWVDEQGNWGTFNL